METSAAHFIKSHFREYLEMRTDKIRRLLVVIRGRVHINFIHETLLSDSIFGATQTYSYVPTDSLKTNKPFSGTKAGFKTGCNI